MQPRHHAGVGRLAERAVTGVARHGAEVEDQFERYATEPVCGDEITRSAKHFWQLRLRLTDQLGHRERITVDCRDGRISPPIGPVERAYGQAVARRACRLSGQAAEPLA